ncbi:MAG: metallophosphoesterase family protein [Burkholderiaceae bacterium]
MKIALIADPHANREALEAVLEHAAEQRCERHVLLGDFVGYGADPLWVVQRAQELVRAGAVAVKGNHDDAVCGKVSPHMIEAARRAIEWTRAQLTPVHIEFLRALPMQVADGEQLYVHANAHAPERWEYILGRGEAQRSWRATDARYVFCGHVHEPRLFTLQGEHCLDFVPSADMPVPVPAHRRWLVLPGSCGQPRDGNPAACYASFDTGQRTLTYHRVPYDHGSAAAKVAAVGLPSSFAKRLADGE